MDKPGSIKKIISLFYPQSAKEEPGALEESFRSHYRNFRALLTANNNALELMAEMEDALTRGLTFGMAFVRGNSTALSVNVFKMIQCLQALSDGKYGGLNDAYSVITARIEEIMQRQPSLADGQLVVWMDEIGKDDADRVGEKMANLGEVGNKIGLNIPPGFVITASATKLFMDASGLQDEINRLLKTLDIGNLEELYTVSARIQELISGAPVPEELAEEILDGYRRLALKTGAGIQVSMRSSAVGEDHRSTSFAGQYRTQLNITEEFILQAYKEIAASKYRSQAIVYRHQRGFRHQDVAMSVGCLAMVDAARSGVMFSRSPRDPQSPLVEINAAPGLANRVVEGRASTDFYKLDRMNPDRVVLEEKAGEEAVLTPEQLAGLTGAAVRLEEHFGLPQDIEWSIDKEGRIVILQSRPLPQPAEAAVEAGLDAGHCGSSALLAGGLTASTGAACGPAYVVRTTVDLLEFPEGGVLVVESPLPDWATLIDRAVAVITETGHAATHLAIVAREFGIPAVFSVENAIESIENGMEVTVDATRRCVYPGRYEEALKRGAERPNLMAGSPVYQIMQAIMANVTPLNLTDPGSPTFSPSHCKTIHDLTRFCHEKAVAEMFSFGEKTRFDAKSAKQLAGETALKWWVIDLEDGFRAGFDTREKFVFIEDIVSEPMLAIWEGMTAKPWGGPPPVSIKGFGSILYRSTMNPSIDPAVRASMGAKNYFLISKNFCNLNMRLGYHFTLVESFIGKMLTENYVSFQFRGGAADRSRRFVRVRLLREILEKYGFRCEVMLDALTARIEKEPREYLLERLKVLGYLLIHTRQIDMVMGEKVMVERYREKIESDLAGIVPSVS